MLNNNITKVLNQVQGITNSAVLKYPRSILNSPASDIIVSIDMSALDNDEFPDIGVWNLSEFLGTFNFMTKDRNVTFKDKILYIDAVTETDGSRTDVELITNSLSLLNAHNKDTSIVDTTIAVSSVAEVDLSVEDLQQIANASKTFVDLEDVIITSMDGEIKISLSSSNKFNAQSNKFNKTKPAETSKEFKVAVPAENFNKLPSSAYTMHVKYNGSHDAYRLLFMSKDIKNLNIVMNVKK